MGKRKRDTRELKPAYLVYVEGETEKKYISQFKKNFRITSLNIEPEFFPQVKLKDLKEFIENKSFDGYEKVFLLFDVDHYISTGKINDLKSFTQSVRREKTNILFLNPCLEIWFLLHYKYTSKLFNNCEEVIKDLKKYIKNYTKNEEQILNSLLDKKLIQNAINNAKKLGSFSFKTPNTCAEIYKLIEVLLNHTSK